MYFLVSYKKDLLVPDINFAKVTFGGHKQILDLLRRHDVRGVEEVMREHIRSAESYFSIQEKG